MGVTFYQSFSLGMLLSQILTTWNFSTNYDIVPWIGEKLQIGAEFQEFSRNNKYVRVPGKLSIERFFVSGLSGKTYNLNDREQSWYTE